MNYACRVFYISEILRVILDNLTDDKRSVVSIAYSSKTLSGPALDCLWEDMDSFFPFVRLLPVAVRDIWDIRFNVVALSQIKCPPPAQWELFDTYARRVRRIRPGEDYLDRALYQRLLSIRAGIDLFPRLSSLRCYIFNPLTPGMKLFPSSLRFLSIYPEYTLALDGRAELALRQAAQDAPCLEELYIVGIYRLYTDIVLRPLNLKKLHTVCLVAHMLRPADLQSFLRLLSLSPVSNLCVSLHSSSEVSFKPDETDLPLPPSHFPRVQNISVCDGPRRAADIVSRICSPYLNSVTIEHRDRFASLPDYERLFKLLAKRQPPIHSLEVRMRRIYVTTRNEYIRGFLAALETLVDSGLVRLRVEMSLYGAWKIEEDVKRRIRPEAWPTLAYFEFNLTEASILTLPSAHLGDVGP